MARNNVCLRCGVRELQRVYGVGTIIAFFLTGGLWLIALPFYPKECPVCTKEEMKETPIRDNILGFNRYTWYKKWQFWVAFFVLMSIIDQLDISKDVEQAKNLEKVSEKIIIVKNIVDEKDSLLKSYIYEGKSEITKPVMKKESGNVTLQISPSVISDNAKTFGQDYVKRSTESKVTVEYDELWEFKNIGGLSEQQIKDSYNDLDIIRCYWKENKVQACVGLEKKYNGKVDKNNSKIAVYEIVGIDSRNDVLKSLVGD